MVEAARPSSLSRCDERIDERRRELVELGKALLLREHEQQAQRRLLGQVLAPEGSLVSEEVGDCDSEVPIHARTVSPSPMATSRSASTATLA